MKRSVENAEYVAKDEASDELARLWCSTCSGLLAQRSGHGYSNSNKVEHPRIDFANDCNVGYAFINLVKAEGGLPKV
ncbi:hypothetical protein F66182_8664 [Fusarium sp. NRRL 66182]|nr:hypothetical protein F66182_8664 [Fusarium sp. NRRL 66182]